jgi:hypothetical protein
MLLVHLVFDDRFDGNPKCLKLPPNCPDDCSLFFFLCLWKGRGAIQKLCVFYVLCSEYAFFQQICESASQLSPESMASNWETQQFK